MTTHPVKTDSIHPVAPSVFVHAPKGSAHRTTLVRLPDDTVWMHAPPPWSPELEAELADLGPVGHIVAVTPEQLTDCMTWLDHHPSARCWAPAPVTARAVQEQRRVPPSRPPEDGEPPSWSGVLSVKRARGNSLHGVLVHHIPTGVLIVGRMLETRHRRHAPAPVRALSHFSGHPPAIAYTPLSVQVHFVGQRRHLVEAVRWAMHARPIRVIPMRGALLEDNGVEVLADGFSWVGIDGPIPPYARFALGANPGGTVSFFIAAAVTIGLLLGLDLPAPSLTARLVTAVVIADLLGGVVAMSSPSTRAWWRQQGPAWITGSLAIHIMHPLALVAVHGGDALWGAGLWLLALLGGTLVWLWPSRASAGPLSMLIVVLGTLLFSADSAGPMWITGIYLLKLVGCFSYGVRHDTPKV